MTREMTITDLQAKWIGRNVLASTDHNLDDSGRNPRPVESVHYNADDGKFYAFAGEHHSATSAEALDRRLQSLAVA